ncbi:HEAT repeat domain-containing protein [Alistipes sp.]|uniref:HEAT repeat domain-containing protein n=1 Tax=Alistipes sp. TaxID=1872444 RepID=UPI0025B84DD3|nr:HEAT repeat domain-containing protein [Alistipes sp.]
MKRFRILCLALVLPLLTVAAPQITPPGVKSATTFAIFVDSRSYAGAAREIDAYRAVLETEGLGTYLLVDAWASPEPIREQIEAMIGGRAPLEGAVFIGEIPIPMIRDAQHLTSAFKANQARDWASSSVPSDRYYDDPALKFEFLRRDEANPLLFYYSLSPESPQYIASQIYTARIRPPKRAGVDSVDLLRAYLRKVVAAHREANALDNLFVFRGHGYNSEALEAWSGEQVSLREQLPGLFAPGNKVRFYDFQSRWPMKPYLLEKMSQPDVDVALCHHHGSPTLQYITGYRSGSDINTSIENIRLYLRSKIAGSKDPRERTKYFVERYGVPEAWCAVSDSLLVADSIFNHMMDIHVEDLRDRAMNPRFVMFDACFNGSFHKDDCIASGYIFGPGRTIVTQGNTVNALQDKWPGRYIGLLDCGLRIGQWGRHVHYLETHLIGDPTYRFVNRALPSLDLGTALTTRRGDNRFWLRLADGGMPADVEAIALRRLSENGYAKIGDLLYERICNSPYGSVRLEALLLFSTRHDPRLVEALRVASGDSYELIRRIAAILIGDSGDEALLTAAVELLTDDDLSARVRFQLENSLDFFNPGQLSAALKRGFAAKPYLHEGDKRLEALLRRIESTQEELRESFAFIADAKNKFARRKGEITYFRNYPHHDEVPRLIALAEDPSLELELRVAAVEALGWFPISWQRPAIESMCGRILSSREQPEELRKEALKTRNRLKSH